MRTVVDVTYEDFKDSIDALREAEEDTSYLEEEFKKTLILSIASYFEHEITTLLGDFLDKNTSSEKLKNFFRTKAIDRKYHTFFSWEKQNINTFLSLFGATFKNEVSKQIDGDKDLKEAASAFMELGNERNKLAHNNYANYNGLSLTAEEIYQKYKKARKILPFLRKVILD